MEQRPILIVAAMEIGMGFLLEKMENKKMEKVNKYTFYEGLINNYPVVLCHSNVMTFNAAIATTIAINKYNPIAIITEGCSGSTSKEIHRNDIVIGEKCINITSCKMPHKNEGEGSNSLDWELVYFIEGEDDRFEAQYGDNNLVDICKTIPYTKGKVHFGNLGSGDIWNSEVDKINQLNKEYGILCEDMESIAVYYTANTFKIPVIGIRSISDNGIVGEEYDRNVEILSQEFAYELILKMPLKGERGGNNNDQNKIER